MIGVVPIAAISGRLLSRKPGFFVTILMTAIGVGLLFVAEGIMVWVAVIIAGVVRDGFVSILLTMVIETDGVGTKYSGTASGLVQTFGRLGGFFSPLVGNNLAYIILNLPFVFWSALATFALVVSLFMKDVKRRQSMDISIVNDGREFN